MVLRFRESIGFRDRLLALRLPHTVATQVPFQCVGTIDSLHSIPLTSPSAAAFRQTQTLPSWRDPFIIMVALPGALAGILWMLAFTGVPSNVDSLMGTIMAVGIAQSNSILLVSFANDIRVEEGKSVNEAIIEGARTRLRPVLMTALAMWACCRWRLEWAKEVNRMRIWNERSSAA